MASTTREPTEAHGQHQPDLGLTTAGGPGDVQRHRAEGGAEQGHTGEVRHGRQDRTRQPAADRHQDGHPRFLELIDEQRGDNDARHEAVEAKQNAEEPIPQEAREQPSPK